MSVAGKSYFTKIINHMTFSYLFLGKKPSSFSLSWCMSFFWSAFALGRVGLQMRCHAILHLVYFVTGRLNVSGLQGNWSWILSVLHLWFLLSSGPLLSSLSFLCSLPTCNSISEEWKNILIYWVENLFYFDLHGKGMAAFPPHSAQHAMAHLCSAWAPLASERHRYEMKKVQLGQGNTTLAQ